jgi:hypothetical protein
MKDISNHISYQEAVKSQAAERLGINNTPNEEQLRNMQFVGKTVFDLVRQFVGGILFISSFFRSKVLNAALGGSETSDHCNGCAIDIDADVYNTNGVTNKDIFYFILDHLHFDQLIWEFGTDENPAWVHVSKRRLGQNRRQVLRAYRDKNNRVHYRPFENE